MTKEKKNRLSGIDISKKDNKRINIYGMYNSLEDEKLKKEETYRTIFRRERDRILYSGGFRRLQDKTQVMAAVENGDHRTRLTHTLEVEQISVSIADALKLNKDLTSAIALGHDIGHTPFGHAVERFLDKKLKNNGGFSHAAQSVRYLKDKKMNLSKEIIEGILKHDTDSFTHNFLEGNEERRQIKNEKKYHLSMPPGTLEAQVVYWADKIAYLTHDFEDFYKSGLLEKAIKEENYKQEENYKLGESIDKIFEVLFKDVEDVKERSIFDGEKFISHKKIKNAIRNLIRNIIKDLVVESDNRIRRHLIENNNKDKLENNYYKQEIIRNKTNKLIKEIYENSYEYEILKKIEVKKLTDFTKEENLQEIEKLIEHYCNFLKEEKPKEANGDINGEYKQIKKVSEEINKAEEDLEIMKELKKELEAKEELLHTINNIEKIKEYKELLSKDVDVFEKRKNKIKKEAYKNGLIINLSKDTMKEYDKLRNIIDKYYIHSQKIQLSDAKAKRIVEELYDMYSSNINILPIEFKKEIDENESNKTRIVADYISSMSDRYAEEVYMNLNTTGSDYSY